MICIGLCPLQHLDAVSEILSVDERLARGSGTLRALVDRARRLERLNRALARHLGDPLSRHCRLANVDADTVCLHVDSSAWGARVRYQTPEILAYLNRHCGCSGIARVQVRVSPRAHSGRRGAPSRPRLSRETSALLESVAEATSDDRLKTALRRLSRHAV